MDLASAEKACRNGAIAGFISAGTTLVLVSIAVLGNTSGDFKTWDDPWNFLDVALLAGLSFGVLGREPIKELRDHGVL